MPRILSLCLSAALLTQAGAATIELVAGGGTSPDDGPATQVKLGEPFNAAQNAAGELILTEHTGDRVRKLADGQLVTIAGTGVKGFAGDGGPATAAQFDGIHSLAVAPNGDLYLADTWNHRIRKIEATTNVVTTIAGSGPAGDHEARFGGDGGPATEALFGPLYNGYLSPDGGQLYVADLHNRRIRKIDLTTGLVTTVAGNGKKGVPADGAVATEAPLVDPRACAVDAAGRLYVLERGGHAVRVVDPDGRIRTVVGTGKKGYSGDGGAALKATLNGPKYLWIERDGNVLIADAENHVIRRYRPDSGTIDRVAGTGEAGLDGLGGDPLQAQLRRPHGVWEAADGTIYIADSFNGRILRIRG